jgi:hypothetical protein
MTIILCNKLGISIVSFTYEYYSFLTNNLNWEICVWIEDPGWTVHCGAEEMHFFSTESENNVLDGCNGELR